MLTEFFPIRLLLRYSAQIEASLVGMCAGKPKEERVDEVFSLQSAKGSLILLAMAPLAPCLISDALEYERGIIWHVWFWPSGTWFLIVLLWGLVAVCRGCVRGIRLWRRRRR